MQCRPFWQILSQAYFVASTVKPLLDKGLSRKLGKLDLWHGFCTLVFKTKLMPGLFDQNLIYQPAAASYFKPARIVLAKGWDGSDTQVSRAKAICSVYPDVEVIEMPDTPHNRVDLNQIDLLSTHYQGKQTMVLGVHKSALRFSEEEDNTCPNYWHFSPYGFCPYDCKYCYLAGTPGVKFSPTVKVFLNLEQILSQIDKAACKLTEPTAFYLGKLQDSLALDNLTGYSRIMVPFFARQKYARMTMLTKCSDVDNLLGLEHNKHTILSWSLNPPRVSEMFETNVPSISKRISAMQKCAKAGYPVRAVVMPIIPIDNWQQAYSEFLKSLLTKVELDRITLGQICSYSTAMQLTEKKLGRQNTISNQLEKAKSPDGRVRFPDQLRFDVYKHLIGCIKQQRPNLQIGLCLEEKSIFKALGIEASIGQCNCVL
jgi:DNA repair photolyase